MPVLELVAREQGFGLLVLERRELEPEEEKLRIDRRAFSVRRATSAPRVESFMSVANQRCA